MIEMTYKEITVKIKLQGWFPDIYYFNKPKGMTDESYINAIVSTYLLDRDDKTPTPKIKNKSMEINNES